MAGDAAATALTEANRRGAARTLAPLLTPVKEKGVPQFKGFWIPFYTTVRNNPKIRKCAKSLGIQRVQMIGHLALLWSWAMEQRTRGDLSKFDHEDIAFAAEWEGDADEFVVALVRARFLDKQGDTLLVHDWEEYGGIIERDRESRANREAVRRAGLDPESVTVTLPSRDMSMTRNSTVHGKTVQNTRRHNNDDLDPVLSQLSQFEQLMGDDAIAFFAKALATKIPGFTERQFRTVLRAANARGGDVDRDELDRRLTSVRLLADQIAERQKSPNQQRRLSNPLVWAIKAINAHMVGVDDISGLLQ